MKRVLFAFLFSMVFAFAANATNAVPKSKAIIDVKLCLKDFKVKKTIYSEAEIKKIIVDYCGYFSCGARTPSGGIVTFGGVLCAADESAFINRCVYTAISIELTASFL